MALTVLQVTNGAAQVLDAEGRVFPIFPADPDPWWADRAGNLYHPDNFEWELT